MDDFLEGIFSEDSDGWDHGEAEAALYSMVHHSEETYNTSMLEFSEGYVRQRNNVNRWEVLKQIRNSGTPSNYILHPQDISPAANHIPFVDNNISSISKTMFGQRFNNRELNLNYHRTDKPQNTNERIRNIYQRKNNLVPIFVQRNDYNLQYSVDPQTILKVNNFSSFETPRNVSQIESEFNRKSVGFLMHHGRQSGESIVDNSLFGMEQNRNTTNRTNSYNGLKVAGDPGASTSKEKNASNIPEVGSNICPPKRFNGFENHNSKICAVEKNAPKIVEVSSTTTDEVVIISDTDGNEDHSDQSVVEVCIPAKPSPPVVALDSSDESETADVSNKSLILNVSKTNKKLITNSPHTSQSTTVSSKNIKNPLFMISSTSKEIKKKTKKKKKRKLIHSFECKSWTTGMLQFYNTSWGGETYDHQKIIQEMACERLSREEAYGNAIGSSSNNISQSYIFTPLRDIENYSHKQNGHSKSPGKENREIGVSSRKCKRSVKDKDSIVLKELRVDLQDINTEIKFAKSIAGKEGTPAFSQFLVFLVEEKRLEVLRRNKIKPSSMSSILNRARTHAKDAFEKLYDLWFDEQGNRKQCLKTLEKSKVDLIRMSSILSKAGAKAATAFKDLYDLWFTEEGNKTQYLKILKKEGIDLVRVSSILHGAGAKAATAFKDLYDLWFDEQGNKKQCLKTLEKNKIGLVRISSILGGGGAKAATAFKDLYDLWFDEQGNKKQCLKTLEKNKIDLVHISSILSGTGASASKAFIELHDVFFDKQGNKTRYLKHFIIDKDGEGFTLCNLSSMLGRARANAKDAFEELHSVCFNNEGKRTKLLNDFYRAGFKASNLSCMLCGSRARASSILKRLHSVCFDDEGERTELLDDFHRAGFDPYDLCNILSRAADSIKEFHDFCFIKKTKKYLSRFSDEKEGFTVSNLCNILHGAENKVCSALKDFYDVCFDEAGNRAHLLDEFYSIGFTPNDLSYILSMAGNNAASILRDFHKFCFNKENYLSHFLAEKTLFTQKDLSKILIGVGTKVCSTFERLHGLCFDKAGNKTKYLNDLIKGNPSNKIIDILYQKVRKCPSTFLKDDIPPQQLDISIIEESEMEDIDGPSIPLSNEVEHTSLNSNTLPIRNSKKRNLGSAQQQGRSCKKQKVSL